MLKTNKKKQSGQSMVEYLIIVSIVGIGTLGITRVLGQSIQVKFAEIARSLDAEVDGDIGKARVTQENWKKKDMGDFMKGAKARENTK